MTSRSATLLALLGLPAIAFGAYLLRYATGIMYDDSVAIGGVAAVAAGLAFVGVGLGRLVKPVAGIVVFLAGTGIAVARWRTAASDHDGAERATADRQTFAMKLASVCKGSGEPSAAPLAEHGLRPTVILDLDEVGHIHEQQYDPHWAASSLAELQIVACIRTTHEAIETCAYEGEGRHASFSRVRYHESIEIREARTGKLVEEHTFAGGDPPSCTDKVTLAPGTHDFDGAMPADADTYAFMRGHVEH
jgi:hypothetical protein